MLLCTLIYCNWQKKFSHCWRHWRQIWYSYTHTLYLSFILENVHNKCTKKLNTTEIEASSTSRHQIKQFPTQIVLPVNIPMSTILINPILHGGGNIHYPAVEVEYVYPTAIVEYKVMSVILYRHPIPRLWCRFFH